jgi:hypothetical protein
LSSPDKFDLFADRYQQSNFSSVLPEIETDQEKEVLKGDAFERFDTKSKQREQEQYGLFDTAVDVAQQAATKGISGLGGAYGDIASTFGLQRPVDQQLPGEEARNSMQFQILDKIERGETPTAGELMLLSDSDEPVFPRFPTSKEIDKGIEQLTGIGEGKTPAGRIAGRGAKFLGETTALGGQGKVLKAGGAAGLAGQTLREAGAPEGLATGVEVITQLSPSVATKKLAPLSKSGKDIVEKGRKIGMTEAQIAPLLQSEGKVAALSKVAQKGERTKEVFKSIKKSIGDSYETIKSSPLAKTIYKPIEKLKLRKEFVSIKNNLSKTLKPSPEKEAAIKFIDDSLNNLLKNDITPEHLINFWQDINQSVDWNKVGGGKKALAELKKPILETLKKASPKLAEDFAITNELATKYYSISKKLKPDVIDSFINKGELMAVPPAAVAFATGNPLPLKAVASEIGFRYLTREMLVNPYFQTIAGKLVNNFNAGSVKAITQTANQAKEFMERKYPNEDWSFLIDTYEDQ